MDEHVEKNMLTLLDTTYIHREPLGTIKLFDFLMFPIFNMLQNFREMTNYVYIICHFTKISLKFKLNF